MGTRADFYVGRGESAEWIGSIAWDGYPSGIADAVLKATDETSFRQCVSAFLSDREDKSLPADGWPWPWDTSSTTDYAYAFDGNKVHASCFGHAWFDPTVEQADEDEPSEKTAIFPNMKDIKRRPVFGAHSGVIVIGAR